MPLPDTTPKHVRSLARDDVYMQLSTWIIEGILRPEEALRDQEIAARLGVSRTPVREALRRLEDEGLVETAQNRWTRVAPLKAAQVAELYPVVETLEVLALRLASPEMGASQLAHLQTSNDRLQAALYRQDAQGAVDADTDFHDVWISTSGNRELQQTLRGLRRKLRRAELAYFDVTASGRASVHEHDLILHALAKGDLETAVLALQVNWQKSLNRLRRQLMA